MVVSKNIAIPVELNARSFEQIGTMRERTIWVVVGKNITIPVRLNASSFQQVGGEFDQYLPNDLTSPTKKRSKAKESRHAAYFKVGVPVYEKYQTPHSYWWILGGENALFSFENEALEPT